jgi:hypothetical protein
LGSAVESTVYIFESHGEGAALGAALVATLPWVVGSDGGAEWVATWTEAVGADSSLAVAANMLQAGFAWAGDRDQAHLLRLPAEQRAIVDELLFPEEPN